MNDKTQQPQTSNVCDDAPWLKTYQRFNMQKDIQLPAEDTSLLDIFEKSFAKYRDNNAFTCMGVSLTFHDLDIYSRQVATYLQSLGLKKGDKVAVMLPNILQYPVCMLGVLRAGLTLVNVNPLYTSHELEHQLVDSQAKVLFIVENFAHTFEKVKNKGNIEHVVVTSMGDLMGTLKGFMVNMVVRHLKKLVPQWHIANHINFKDILTSYSASNYQRPTLTLNDVAILQYTGGTTGVAKGAMLIHQNLVANLLQVNVFVQQIFPDGSDNKDKHILVALPLYHIFSFTACALVGIQLGFVGLLIPNPRDLPNLVKEMDKYKPVFIPAVNTLFNALAHNPEFRKIDHSHIKMVLGGGMSVLENTAKEWERITGVPILEGYGLSETSPAVTLNPSNIGKYTGKIGIPIPSTDIKLLDDDNNKVAIGERGEICVKGPQVMIGYWNRPEATEEVTTEDGYFRTGDIGVMDEEGFIKIVDRKKDMILVSGFNVYPNEVEDTMTNHPKIVECGVIGIPDERSGEVPKIYVVRKDATLTADEVLKYAKENLTGYKRPRHVEFIDELPKSNVGKILRKDLRELEKQG